MCVILGVVSIKLPHLGLNLQFDTKIYHFRSKKIYHFASSFLQFAQITDLRPINNDSDLWDPHDSADVVEIRGYLLRWKGSHMSEHSQKLSISKTN
jgi:hypothetical protein